MNQIFTAKDPYSREIDLHHAHMNGVIPTRPSDEIISNVLWEVLLCLWDLLPERRPRATDALQLLEKVIAGL